MEYVGIAAAILAVPAVIAFGDALFNGGNRLLTGSALAVLLLTAALINDPPLSSEECWIEWDGRSNATVCQ